MQHRWFVRLVCAIGAMGLVIVGAGEAFADSAPVSVNATVTIPNATSLSGVTGTITFPPQLAGFTTTARGAEAYSVATNDPKGATLEWQQPADGKLDGAQNDPFGNPTFISDTAITVNETATSTGAYTFAASSGGAPPPLVISNSISGTESFAEDWSLAIPSGQVGGSYSGGFVVLALSN